MKKILLIVSSHEDAALLPKAAVAIGKLGCGLLWVWHSPILGIDPEKECSVIDAELKALAEGEKSAAALGDYKTAEERKAAREKLLLNRSVEIRNAWKRVSPEGRKEAIGRFMEPLLDVLNPKRDASGVGVRISAFPEHQESDLWIAALNEVKGVLEKAGFKGGEFAMMWPRQLVDIKFEKPLPLAGTLSQTEGENTAPSKLPEPLTHTLASQRAAFKDLPPISEKVPVPALPTATPDRKAELTGMRHFSLKSVAKKLNVPFDGRPKPEVITDILRAEELATM